MINFRVAVRTTVLLVDDDARHLNLRALAFQAAGFSVVNATSPLEAISIMNENSLRKIDVAVVDYHMPVMNGCILAEYLKARYPELKIILYSGAIDIPERELTSVDDFVPKSSGIATLLAKIAGFTEIDPVNSTIFPDETSLSMNAVN